MAMIVESFTEPLTDAQWETLTGHGKGIVPEDKKTEEHIFPCCGFRLWKNKALNVESFFWQLRNQMSFCPSCGLKHSLKSKENAL